MEYLKKWFMMLLRDGTLTAPITSETRLSSIIHDDDFREKATLWMAQTIKTKKPQPTSDDFIGYVFRFYNLSISETTSCLWLRSLGFNFKGQSCTQVYFDGHEREDVVLYREKYVDMLWELKDYMISFGGDDMLDEILGEGLANNLKSLLVLVTHDETTVYSKGGLSRAWGHDRAGRMVEKGRGESRMISAYCSELIGWLRKSAKIINPKRDKVSWVF